MSKEEFFFGNKLRRFFDYFWGKIVKREAINIFLLWNGYEMMRVIWGLCN